MRIRIVIFLFVALLLAFRASANCGTSTNVTCVQAVSAVHTSGVPAITISGISAGDSIFVIGFSYNSVTGLSTTPTSSAGNSYSNTGCPFTQGYEPWSVYWYCWKASGVAAGTDTVTFGTSNFVAWGIMAIEFSSLGTFTGDAKGSNHVNNAATLTATTGSVSGTDELALAIGVNTNSTATTWTAGTNFTNAVNITNSSAFMAEGEWLENTSASGAQSCPISWSPSFSGTTENLCFTFKVTLPQCGSIVFSPEPGTYPSAQNVALSSSGCSVICYTTNGTAPTESGNLCSGSSLTYSTPISVPSTLTIKALATKTGWTDSPITVGAFTIGAAPPPIYRRVRQY